MLCTVLHPKGETRNSFLPAGTTGIPTAAHIGTMLRRATPPDFIGSWSHESSLLHLYGYKTGKAGTENSHELPPPHDSILLFGEAVVVATTEGQPTKFNGEDYKKFFNTAMGGFEDIEDSEDEEEEEEEEEEVEEVAEEEEEEAPLEEGAAEAEPEVIKRKAPPKTKKASKKLPAFYALPELEPEPYTYVRPLTQGGPPKEITLIS